MKSLQKILLALLIVAVSVTILSAQWIKTNGPKTELTLSLAVAANNEGDTVLYAGTLYGGIFCSSDYGESWVVLNRIGGVMGDTGFTKKDIRVLLACPDGLGKMNLFAGTDGAGVFLSANADTNWTAVNNGLLNHSISSLISHGTNLYAGTSSGIFLSTNNGSSWAAVNDGLTDTSVTALAVNINGTGGTNLFAGVWVTGGVLRSTDNGAHWTVFNNELTSYSVYALVASRTKLFASTTGGVFCSTDDGTTWKEVNHGLTASQVNTLAVDDTIIFAGTSDYGVYYSVDGGANWVSGGGMEYSPSVVVLAKGGRYLFAGVASPGTSLESVWRRPLSEMVTGVGDRYEQTRHNFVLEQNYPNPFNPSTNISFRLPSRSFVSLKVYDIIGREVETLVSQELPAGDHTKKWNAGNLSSGVYYYRLSIVPSLRRDLVTTDERNGQAGTLTETKKLILLR